MSQEIKDKHMEWFRDRLLKAGDVAFFSDEELQAYPGYDHSWRAYYAGHNAGIRCNDKRKEAKECPSTTSEPVELDRFNKESAAYLAGLEGRPLHSGAVAVGECNDWKEGRALYERLLELLKEGCDGSEGEFEEYLPLSLFKEYLNTGTTYTPVLKADKTIEWRVSI